MIIDDTDLAIYYFYKDIKRMVFNNKKNISNEIASLILKKVSNELEELYLKEIELKIAIVAQQPTNLINNY